MAQAEMEHGAVLMAMHRMTTAVDNMAAQLEARLDANDVKNATFDNRLNAVEEGNRQIMERLEQVCARMSQGQQPCCVPATF